MNQAPTPSSQNLIIFGVPFPFFFFAFLFQQPTALGASRVAQVFAHRADLHRGLWRHRPGRGFRGAQDRHGADFGRADVARPRCVVNARKGLVEIFGRFVLGICLVFFLDLRFDCCLYFYFLVCVPNWEEFFGVVEANAKLLLWGSCRFDPSRFSFMKKYLSASVFQKITLIYHFETSFIDSGRVMFLIQQILGVRNCIQPTTNQLTNIFGVQPPSTRILSWALIGTGVTMPSSVGAAQMDQKQLLFAHVVLIELFCLVSFYM